MIFLPVSSATERLLLLIFSISYLSVADATLRCQQYNYYICITILSRILITNLSEMFEFIILHYFCKKFI